jgi:oligoendopeptidase F
MPYAPSPTWNLDALFPGGPDGAAFIAEADALAAELDGLVARCDAVPADPDAPTLVAAVAALQSIVLRLEQLSTFAGCSAAADTVGKGARRAEARATVLWNRYTRAWVVPNARVGTVSDARFAEVLAHPDMAELRGFLDEKRRLARFRLPEAEEALSTELARDGLLAWGESYDAESGALLAVLTGHEERVTGVEVSPDGRWALTTSWDHRARRWDLTVLDAPLPEVPPMSLRAALEATAR